MAKNLPEKPQLQFLIYQTEEGETRLEVRLQDETVWLTQRGMAELFQSTVPNINLHLKNIYNEGELTEDTTVKDFLIVQQESSRQVERKAKFYNLDVIISVGYRIKSKIATRFRQWATMRLREYIIKGFVLFLREKNGDMLTYQIFFEPRGKHLKEHDKWKQDFLREITEKFKGQTPEYKTRRTTQKYRLVAVPFYNNEDENKFKQSLYEVMEN